MQPWEYKVVHRARLTQGNGVGQWDTGIVSMLPELGDEGWELIAIAPRSSAPGSTTSGVTSDEMWVFKRPKTVLTAETTVIVAQATATPGVEALPTEAVASASSSVAE